LKAQRLAAAGGHDGEQVAAAKDVGHHLLLPGTEGIKAKALLELCRKGGWSQVGWQRVVHLAKNNLVSLRRCGPNLGVSTTFCRGGAPSLFNCGKVCRVDPAVGTAVDVARLLEEQIAKNPPGFEVQWR
jgi:hypothetical protein